MATELMKKADLVRPESLNKNLYKIQSPYDLTSDEITRALNALQSITGYDYRTNPIVDLFERLVDAKDSKLVRIGGERLLVEFGRRAGMNLLDKFIPTPTNFLNDIGNIFRGGVKKKDKLITDTTKDKSRNFLDRIAEKTIGFKSNDNFLETKYIGYENITSEINFFYSGKLVQEEIQKINKLNTFSNFDLTKKNIFYDFKPLVFRNTYSRNFIGDLQKSKTIYGEKEVFSSEYFTYNEKENDKLSKDYINERRDLETTQGFGKTNLENYNRNDDTKLKTENKNKVVNVGDLKEYVYDSFPSIQEQINQKFGVKRGLVYFTSKLAQESNSTIAQTMKELFVGKEGGETVYYKGNGECRTFTILDQYDNFNKVIKFDGNNQPNSVIKNSVLPRIAPMVNDNNNEPYTYFFTMENLALVDNKLLDCEKGPNGGRWMWFPPYDVKISDNNSVNWSDMFFLGRPEPLFSYQNTTRSLSLSFKLLIDTVKNMQDLEPTIQNYYNYLYNCGDKGKVRTTNNNIQPAPPAPTVEPKTSTKKVELNNKAKYRFKNEGWSVDFINPDYTSIDTDPNFSSFTYNNSFLNEFNQSVNFIKQLMSDKNVVEIRMRFEGAATRLITQDLTEDKAIEFNRALGMRRADNLMRNVIYQYNDIKGEAPEIKVSNFKPIIQDSIIDGLGQVINPVYIKEGTVGKDESRLYTQVIDGKKITVTITSVGADSDPKPVDNDPSKRNINDKDRVEQRYAVIESIVAKVETTVDDTTQTQPQQTQTPASTTGQTNGNDCDDNLKLTFQKLDKNNKFPVGFEKLNTFTPVFNSQTPFDFTNRYTFLHQLTRPSKLFNETKIDNTVFGRMPVFVIRYGDFIHSKAIARSINFDIQESTWDLNPEGMGAIPIWCNVTMDITLFGGQSLAGPIDRIQTANDLNFIANSTFNSGKYKGNNTFKPAREQEDAQYKSSEKK
jgi:hypothetical protein